MDKDKKDLIKFSIVMGALAIISFIVIFSSYNMSLANNKPAKVVDPYYDHVVTNISLDLAGDIVRNSEISWQSKDGSIYFLKGGERIDIITEIGWFGNVKTYATSTRLPKYSGAYPIEYSQVEMWR